MSKPGLCAIVSIHDVMPETRAQVTRMLETLGTHATQLQAKDITLLIVPGRPWSQSDLLWLRQLAAAGHPLAGHGWQHQAVPKRSWFHRLHSLLLSRNAAEHLSQSSQTLQQLISHCFHWFYQRGLPRPQLYVPPAWAAGDLDLAQWRALPFEQVETLSGVINLSSGQRHHLPLTGYEADTVLRALLLRAFNFLNKLHARYSGRPLRIGLHPYDLNYRLAQNALSDLKQVELFYRYSDLR